MNLRTALRLDDAPRVAFVGAGGKTTGMFALAREYPRALVTTTTHLGAWQADQVDAVRVIRTAAEAALVDLSSPGVMLLVGGEPTPDDRLPGLSPDVLARVAEWAQRHRLPLLIEADGARGLPLKAPAEHEPAIPPLDGLTVVVVAGLSALGQPLDGRHVHRPERFAALSGLRPGEQITVEALAAVLRHPEGGLKGIPPDAQRALLLTQAADPQQQAQAGWLAEALLAAFPTVMMSRPLSFSPSTPPSLSPQGRRKGGSGLAGPQGGRERGESLSHTFIPVAGVVLAAGSGSRMGQPKQVLRWRGKPLVRHVVETGLLAGLDPLVVVTGAHRDAVRAALKGLPVEWAHNAAWTEGQSGSVRTGVQALPPQVGAAVFLLADQPHIPPTLIAALVAEHRRTQAPIIAPQADGRRANPVLFDRVTFPDLCALQGDTGGRAIFARFPLRYLPWLDERILLDVDTMADWERLQGDG